jgi:hypothetical protein
LTVKGLPRVSREQGNKAYLAAMGTEYFAMWRKQNEIIGNKGM